MTNFFSRIAISGILAAGALFAAQINDLKVTLPHAVTVGSTTLPSGAYTISPMEMSDGSEYFVVRGDKTGPVVLQAQRIEGATATKTQVTISESGDTWRFDKLLIEGESTGYEFVGGK
jgi:hypothetical protein